MIYNKGELVNIGKRENNKKRNYLVINPLQGKHIPTSPYKALTLFNELAEKIHQAFSDEKILFIGFAETATAIGAQVAISVGGLYIQTTREIIGDVNYLFFSETHSHATEQKLVKEDIESVIRDVDRVIFVEDEVTTGNTILNIINILEQNYGEIKFAVASLLNGMNENCRQIYEQRQIKLLYLVKTNHDEYTSIADGYNDNGEYCLPQYEEVNISTTDVCGAMNTRRLVETDKYLQQVEALWNSTRELIQEDGCKRYLVIGTEEFMYPALYIGNKLEEQGYFVRSHSTTRSPIVVSNDEGYPLKERFEIRSLYDEDRITYIYNLQKYDKVIILTDSSLINDKGKNSLINAVKKYNDNIMMIRWC